MNVSKARRISFVAFLFFAALAMPAAIAQQGVRQIREFRGQTMGTTYMVKVAGHEEVGDDEIRLSIDAELRQVNDEMSTYLKTSEISQFNAGQSTDWFSVSPAFAMVVQQALEISADTDGAFDVTVAPLVNAWSFGPGDRTQQVPDAQKIQDLRKRVGFRHLKVRMEPPAIRKDLAGLQLDLSSIAKGHGVDRVIDRLKGLSITNVFVEIGGEVRTVGDKPGGAWKVGIQVPDAAQNTVLLAHPMLKNESAGNAMATSGDYRNFFVVDGKRYSHTIDPRTGAPVEHSLASATVIAPNCMLADAWATALCVVGPKQAKSLAEQNGLSILIAERQGDSGFALYGSGALESYATTALRGNEEASTDWSALFPIMLVTFGIFSILLFAMAVGVVANGKQISGSCGGIASKTNEDGSTSCSLCSNPSTACKELRDRMQTSSKSDAQDSVAS